MPTMTQQIPVVSNKQVEDAQLKTALQSVTFDAPNDLAPYVYKLYKEGVPRQKCKEMLLNSSFTFDTRSLDIPAILDIVVNDIYDQNAFCGPDIVIDFSFREREFILKYCDKFKEDKTSILNLLAAFLAFSRYDDYETGWINYNKKKIFTLAGLSKMPEKTKTTILNTLVADNIIQFKVIGKKNPILCFYLPWRDVTAPQLEDVCCMISIAPDTTSKEFLQQLNWGNNKKK